MNPWAIYFFGVLIGVAGMLVVLQLMLSDIKRSLRRIIRDETEELKRKIASDESSWKGKI